MRYLLAFMIGLFLVVAVDAQTPVMYGKPVRQGDLPHCGVPFVNGTAIVNGNYQMDVKNRWPDGSVKFAIASFIDPAASGGTIDDIGWDDTGVACVNTGFLSSSQMLAASFNFDAQIQLNGGSPFVSARAILTAANTAGGCVDPGNDPDGSMALCTYWMKGPVVTAVKLEDRSAARAYDMKTDALAGNPLHPYFIAYFFPSTNQVLVEYVLENDWASTIANNSARDQTFSLVLTGGNSGPFVISGNWGATSQTFRTRTVFHRTYCAVGAGQGTQNTCNATPAINHNYGYLATTKFFPNWDPSLQLSQTYVNALTTAFNATATNKGLTGSETAGLGFYPGRQAGCGGSTASATGDACSSASNGMNQSGPAYFHGPLTTWEIVCLLTSDAGACNTVTLGNADLGYEIPYFYREADASAGHGGGFLATNSNSATPTAGSVGTQGRVVSINARTQVNLQDTTFQGPTVCNTVYPADWINFGGPTGQDLGIFAGDSGGPQQTGSSHWPNIALIPYTFTGFYGYYEEQIMQSAYAVGLAGDYNPGTRSCFQATSNPSLRQGAAGYWNADQERGNDWDGRENALGAFLAVDSSPEQTYLVDKLKMNLAALEGSHGIPCDITGTGLTYPYCGTTGGIGTTESAWSYGNGSRILNTNVNGTPLGAWAQGPSNASSGGYSIQYPICVGTTGTGASGSTSTLNPGGFTGPSGTFWSAGSCPTTAPTGPNEYANSYFQTAYSGVFLGWVNDLGFCPGNCAMLNYIANFYINQAMNPAANVFRLGGQYVYPTVDNSGTPISTWANAATFYVTGGDPTAWPAQQGGFGCPSGNTGGADEWWLAENAAAMSYMTGITSSQGSFSGLSAYNKVRSGNGLNLCLPYFSGTGLNSGFFPSPKWDIIPRANVSTNSASPSVPPPWTGIVDPSRAINWGNAGVLDFNGLGVGNGGAGIPSASWSQSGGTAATINPYGPSQSPSGDTGSGSVIVTSGSTTMTLLSGSSLQSYWPGLDIIIVSTSPTKDNKFIFNTVNAGGVGSTFTVTAAPTFSSPATTGTISSGSNLLTVLSVSGASVGDGIQVNGAGAAGANLLTTITAINSSTLVVTLTANASTSVGPGAVVTYGSVFRGGGALDPLTIQNALNNCGANQFVLLGPGTFNLDGGLRIPSNCVLRGSGADKTFVNAYLAIFGCGNTTNFICISGDGTAWGSSAAFPGGTQAATFLGASTTSTVTSGTYQQNGTFISVSAVGSNGIKVGQWIYLTEKDELGDNGSYFNCASLSVNPVCAFEGLGGAGMNTPAGTYYQQVQAVQVTSIPASCGTTCTGAGPFTLGISTGIYGIHWLSTLTPYVWWPLAVTQNAGVENFSIDSLHLSPSNISGTVTVGFTNAVNSWVSGMATTHGNLAHVWLSPAAHITIERNYFWATINAASQSYGVEPFGPSVDNLIQNNICQQVVACAIEGPQMGSVYFGNFSIQSTPPPFSFMSQQVVEHDGAVMYNLYDQNIGTGLYSDPFHGTHGLNTAYRNRWNGHECVLNGGSPTCTTGGAWPVEVRVYNRMMNFVENVLGTTGFHNPASAPAGYENQGGQNAIYYTQAGGGETSNITSISVDGGTGTAYTVVVSSSSPTTGGIGGNLTVAGVANANYNNAPGTTYVVTSTSGNTIHMTGPNQTLAASSGGTIGPIMPNDPLVTSTMLRWGNWDTVTNTTRWCAFGHTGYTTTCNSTSEVTPGLVVGTNNYANSVPTLGDTGPAMPPSFYYQSKPTFWPSSKPWPIIGSDVSGGNIGICGPAGTGNYPFNNATASSQCTGTGATFTASDAAGHANSNLAMDCYLTTMGGPPDGSGSALTYNANTCYNGGAPPPLTVTLTPNPLAFGGQNINTTSAPQSVTLKNTSTANVSISAVSVVGNFTLAGGTCPTPPFSLTASATCTFNMTFSPTATIAYSGCPSNCLSVTDTAVGSPHTVNLTGQGTQATIAWTSVQGSSTTYNYGNVAINTTVQSSNITLQNTGTGPLIVAVTVTGTNASNFSPITSTNCPASLPAGSSCNYIVPFSPTSVLSYSALLTETDGNASNSPLSLSLIGNGVIPLNIVAPQPIIIITEGSHSNEKISDHICRDVISGLTFLCSDAAGAPEYAIVDSVPH